MYVYDLDSYFSWNDVNVNVASGLYSLLYIYDQSNMVLIKRFGYFLPGNHFNYYLQLKASNFVDTTIYCIICIVSSKSHVITRRGCTESYPAFGIYLGHSLHNNLFVNNSNTKWHNNRTGEYLLLSGFTNKQQLKHGLITLIWNEINSNDDDEFHGETPQMCVWLVELQLRRDVDASEHAPLHYWVQRKMNSCENCRWWWWRCMCVYCTWLDMCATRSLSPVIFGSVIGVEFRIG